MGDFAKNFGAINFIIMQTILGQQMLLNGLGTLLQKQKGRKSFRIATTQILGDFAQNFRAAIFIIVRMILGQQMLLHADNFVA